MKRHSRNEEENYYGIVNVGKNHVAACEAESGKKFRRKKRSKIPGKDENSECSQRKKDRYEPEIRPVIGKSERFQQNYDELHSRRRFTVSKRIFGGKHRTTGSFTREK